MIVRYQLSYDRWHVNRDRIYRVVSDFRYPEGTEFQQGVPGPLPMAMRHEFPQLEVVAEVMGANNSLMRVDEAGVTRKFKERNGIFYAGPEFFRVFSFNWLYGDPQSVLSAPNTIALTKSTAERYFGEWRRAIGKTIRKDNEEVYTVQGILADPPVNTDLPLKGVVSYASIKRRIEARPWGSVSSGFQCYILLPGGGAPGSSAGSSAGSTAGSSAGSTARSSAGALASVIAQLPAFRAKYRDNKTDFFSLQPLPEIHFDARYGNLGGSVASRQSLWILSLIGVFILCLGCINFINLATAQAVNRSREVGIRKVLGGRRWQLGLQFMGETGLLVGVSMAAALAMVSILAPMAGRFFDGAASLRPLESPDAIGFLVLTGGIVTLLSGAYPALVIAGFKPIEALKSKVKTGKGAGLALRRSLVVSQFVIAQALIIGVLVAGSQMDYFLHAPMGFNKQAVITLSLPGDSASRLQWKAFRQRVVAESGVADASLSNSAPASRGYTFLNFNFDGRPQEEHFEINVKAADAAYFSTYGLTLAAGRICHPSDTIREFVVNETFCRREGYTDPRAILGKKIQFDDNNAPIVGVVRDFHQHSLRDPIDPAVIATASDSYSMMGVKLRGRDMKSTVDRIGQLFAGYFPDALFEHQWLDESIAHYYEQEEKEASAFQLFAVVAMVISCLGLYGLILFTTTQRTREVGIRKLLGASISGISLMFVREFLLLIGLAFLIAAPLAWYGMHRWLESFTFRVEIAWWVFAVTAISALVVGVLTIGLRTLRTAMENPVKSLRSLSVVLLATGIACLVGTERASAQGSDTAGYAPEVRQRIEAVEHGLAGWVKEADGNGQGWSIQERMIRYKVKAVSIAVINDYRIEWAKAYGWADSAEKRAATTALLFQAASISKSLNGVGVMRLVQEGKLDLSADINTYLKKWKFPYDSLGKGKKISMANLLSHTGGLTVHGFGGYARGGGLAGRGDSIPDIYQILDGKRPANSPAVRSMYEPGLKSEYSGGGITISQLVVQDITGEPYDQYMWKNVLQPMGMTASTYTQPPPAGKAGLLATGYRGNGKELPGKYHIYPEQAAAGLWTNPTDLAHYIIETQLSYEGKSSKVLDRATTIRRLTPFVDSNAAMGVFISSKGGVRYFGHGGANEGFRCQYLGSLEGGRGVVVMVNSDNGGILGEIMNSVANTYQWKDFYKPVVKVPYVLDATTAASYTGHYVLGGDTLIVYRNGGTLWLDIGAYQWELHFSSARDFWVYEDEAVLAFTVKEGKVEGILVNHKNTAKKVD